MFNVVEKNIPKFFFLKIPFLGIKFRNGIPCFRYNHRESNCDKNLKESLLTIYFVDLRAKNSTASLKPYENQVKTL